MVPLELQSISNTLTVTVHTEYKEGKHVKMVTFQTTPVMSTYLVALAVGLFDGVSQMHNGVLTTVCQVWQSSGTCPAECDMSHKEI
jgi:aminopeptidase N